MTCRRFLTEVVLLATCMVCGPVFAQSGQPSAETKKPPNTKPKDTKPRPKANDDLFKPSVKKRKPEEYTPPAFPAQTQAEAVKFTKTFDLPAIEQSDRLVIDDYRSGKKVTINKQSEISLIRKNLVIRDQAPSDQNLAIELSFFRGDRRLRKVWVFADGEWGIERPSSSKSWTIGRQSSLIQAIEQLLARAPNKSAGN